MSSPFPDRDDRFAEHDLELERDQAAQDEADRLATKAPRAPVRAPRVSVSAVVKAIRAAYNLAAGLRAQQQNFRALASGLDGDARDRMLQAAAQTMVAAQTAELAAHAAEHGEYGRVLTAPERAEVRGIPYAREVIGR